MGTPMLRTAKAASWRGKFEIRKLAMSGDKTEIHDLRERVSALEANMQHMATKAWVLAGVVGGMGLAAVVALAAFRLFSV